MPPPTMRQVRCPSCHQSAPYDSGNPWRPFCSERCRSADLGAWASERFRVPAQPSSEQIEGPPGGTAPADEPHSRGH